MDENSLFNTENPTDFPEDLDMAIEKLSEMTRRLAKAEEIYKREVISDRISTPIAIYDIQTGPFLFSDNGEWITVMSCVIRGTDKEIGPCAVQKYDYEEEAERGHYEWRSILLSTPPMIMRDVMTKKVYPILV